MKRDFFLVSIFVLLVSLTSAQEYSVVGTVLNTERMALVYANVVLVSKDGNPIKGTSTDENGKFSLAGIPPGDYTLYASYIESTSNILPLAIRSDLDVGEVLILKKHAGRGCYKR